MPRCALPVLRRARHRRVAARRRFCANAIEFRPTDLLGNNDARDDRHTFETAMPHDACRLLSLPNSVRDWVAAIKRTDDPASTAIEHVCVDHSGGDVAVAEQFLHGPNVITCLEQVRSE